MVKNILLEVQYLGTAYFGFQRQNKPQINEPTVQQEIEAALEKLFKQKININAASRTDRGVHAYGQIVNFKVNTKLDLLVIKRAINSFLPLDIAVKTIKLADQDFHARYQAKSKHYQYIILNQLDRSVFWADRSWHVHRPLDIKAMSQAARLFVGIHDFKRFAKRADEYECGIRRIKKITVKRKLKFVYIDIVGSGFMHNMVRNITTFLVKVGLQNISLAQAKNIFCGQRPYSNVPAKPCGLYLMKVNY